MTSTAIVPADSPRPAALPDSDLDVVVEVMRAAGGWRRATDAGNQRRQARGLRPISIRQMKRVLRLAGRLEDFPRPPNVWHRPSKADLTDEECNIAMAARAMEKSWDDTVALVNAGRPEKDRISDRTLRDRLRERGLWRPTR